MAVLTTHRAFLLGYLPPLAGVSYNTLAFIEGAQRQPHLRERATQRAATLRAPDPAREAEPAPAATAPGEAPSIGNRGALDRIEALLQDAGLPGLPRPRDLASYTEWAQRIQREVRTALAGSVEGLAAYNLGALLGDLALTLNLLALVHELRPRPDEEPPWLSAQRRGLLADVERGRVRLALLCRGPATAPTGARAGAGPLPPEVTDEANRCLRHLDADLSTAAAAASLQRHLLQRVAAIEAAFPAPPGKPRARG